MQGRTLFLSPAAARPAVKNRNSVHTLHYTMHYTPQHNRQTCDVDTAGLLSLLPILFVIHHSVIGSLSNGCVMSQRMFWQSFPYPSCPGVLTTPHPTLCSVLNTQSAHFYSHLPKEMSTPARTCPLQTNDGVSRCGYG